MDLERIKQNFRLRSGRTKKTRKHPVPAQTQIQKTPEPPPLHRAITPAPTTKPLPNKSTTSVSGKKKGDSELQAAKSGENTPRPAAQESLPSQNYILPPRPDLPHAATGINVIPNLTTNNPSRQPTTRYGRSGIEKQRQSLPPGPLERTMSEPLDVSDSDKVDFDLRPPPRKPKPPSLENLSTLLFSDGHLDTIIHDPQLLLRLTTFLHRYKPDLSPVLIRYLETQKAIKAVEYANAVAESVTEVPNDANDAYSLTQEPIGAAQINTQFTEFSTSAFTTLLSTALPAYVTYRLVKLVSECLTNEITGRSTPIMRDLVGGLSEIFCLTDPNQEDNPIIYASEEFFRQTGYDTDDVIGHNCRFLQGPKTIKDSPKRLRQAVEKGEQACETLLNYRRDGRAFVNLLMIAPLYDDKGTIKYYIGAQVDVSKLVDGGKGLDGFEKFLQEKNKESGRGRSEISERGLDAKKKRALAKLKDLSMMFDLEESAVVQSNSRSSSMTRGDGGSVHSKERPKTTRRVLAESSRSESEDENDTDERETAEWKLAKTGPSGKLPGVYQTYLLLRPSPSLRIIFVSPALRKLGDVMQSRFLAHVAAPSKTLAGLKESLESGVPVTAKIGFMTQPGRSRDGTRTYGKKGQKDEKGSGEEHAASANTCWISATPLLGQDDRIGVWMVVMIQESNVATDLPEPSRASDSKNDLVESSRLKRPQAPRRKTSDRQNGVPLTPRKSSRRSEDLGDDVPIKPRRLGSLNALPGESSAIPASFAADSLAPVSSSSPPVEDLTQNTRSKEAPLENGVLHKKSSAALPRVLPKETQQPSRLSPKIQLEEAELAKAPPSEAQPSEQLPPRKTRLEEPQPKDTQPKDAQQKEVHPEEPMPKDVQAEEAPPDEVHLEEPGPEDAQTEEVHLAEAKPEEPQLEEPRPAEVQQEEAPPDEVNPEKLRPDDALAEEVQADEAQPEEVIIKTAAPAEAPSQEASLEEPQEVEAAPEEAAFEEVFPKESLALSEEAAPLEKLSADAAPPEVSLEKQLADEKAPNGGDPDDQPIQTHAPDERPRDKLTADEPDSTFTVSPNLKLEDHKLNHEPVPKSVEEMEAWAREVDERGEDDESDDDVFIRKHKTEDSSHRPGRIYIKPDSDDEGDGLEGENLEGLNHEVVADDSGSLKEEPMENQFHSGELAAAQSDQDADVFEDAKSDSEVTPTRTNITANGHSDPNTGALDLNSSRPSSSRGAGPESNSARPSGMLYLDFLRHPTGGQTTHRMSHSMTMNEGDGAYFGGEVKDRKSDAGSSTSEDLECSRSPYSVD